MKKVLRLTGFRGLLQKEAKFKQSAQELGDISIDFVCYKDLFFDIDGSFKNIKTQASLSDYDYYWIGGTSALPFKRAFTYYYAHILGKKLIDKRCYHMLDMSKLSQLVLLKYLDIPHPKSVFFVNDGTLINEKIQILKDRFDFPLVMKNPIIDRGEWVSLVKNEAELRIYLENVEKNSCSLVQEYIDNNGDYRVIATKTGVIGGIKRYNDKDFRNNVSVGWATQAITEFPQSIHLTSLKILEHYGLDVAGIDYFILPEGFYVIEINDLPQYAGFEQATGISYTKAVLEYIKSL